MSKTPSQTWVHFLAGTDKTLKPLTMSQNGRLSLYRVRKVVPIRGEAPNLKQGWSVVRIETSSSLPSNKSSGGSSVIEFYGVTQHLHYTSDAQRKELDRHSVTELEPSDQTMGVLIPIRKSEEWWKLSQDQRQSYFQKTDAHEGHTAVGLKYVDRIFRKLYHSRYLNAVLSYDFLTYFEFKDVYENDFRTLLSELRDTNHNPEWTFVDREFEIWMIKIG